MSSKLHQHEPIEGRHISNGVVVCYAVTVVSLTVLVALGHLDGDIGLVSFLGLFILTFAGDLLLQLYQPGDEPQQHVEMDAG